MSEIVIGPDNEALNRHLHNEYESGWNFGSGDPEFWQLSDQMLVPDGKLLDIGIGEGRTSMYFAFNGMQVTGVDSSAEKVASANQIASDLSKVTKFDLDAVQLDVFEDPLPGNDYDTILIGQLVHVDSKQKALDLFDKALASLKPGGHIWVRAAGKEAYAYEGLFYTSIYDPYPARAIDNDVIEHMCRCSGELKYEPTLFFDPLDLSTFFSQKGCRIVHSQTIPTDDRMNIMFGEDYNPEDYNPRGGMVTVLAQKPLL